MCFAYCVHVGSCSLYRKLAKFQNLLDIIIVFSEILVHKSLLPYFTQEYRHHHYRSILIAASASNVYVYFQEEELRSIQLQEKVDELQEEKERILNSLVEAE